MSTSLSLYYDSALYTNISLGRKYLAVTNALAYRTTESITAVKSFMVLGPMSSHQRASTIKLFWQ
jgi:hypothetical protein